MCRCLWPITIVSIWFEVVVQKGYSLGFFYCPHLYLYINVFIGLFISSTFFSIQMLAYINYFVFASWRDDISICLLFIWYFCLNLGCYISFCSLRDCGRSSKLLLVRYCFFSYFFFIKSSTLSFLTFIYLKEGKVIEEVVDASYLWLLISIMVMLIL